MSRGGALARKSDPDTPFDWLAAGHDVSDEEFDRIYPAWAALPSRIHWTPVGVARRAVDLLTRGRRKSRVLDVGSGAGKFCLVAAALSPAEFTGVEQRRPLVELSRELASRYGIAGARFEEGDAQALDWNEFDSIYLYNPFEELRSSNLRIDESVSFDPRRYHRRVGGTYEKLRCLRSGMRVVTYHGYGASFPSTYRQLSKEWCVRGPLECWVQEAS